MAFTEGEMVKYAKNSFLADGKSACPVNEDKSEKSNIVFARNSARILMLLISANCTKTMNMPSRTFHILFHNYCDFYISYRRS